MIYQVRRSSQLWRKIVVALIAVTTVPFAMISADYTAAAAYASEKAEKARLGTSENPISDGRNWVMVTTPAVWADSSKRGALTYVVDEISGWGGKYQYVCGTDKPHKFEEKYWALKEVWGIKTLFPEKRTRTGTNVDYRIAVYTFEIPQNGDYELYAYYPGFHEGKPDANKDDKDYWGTRGRADVRYRNDGSAVFNASASDLETSWVEEIQYGGWARLPFGSDDHAVALREKHRTQRMKAGDTLTVTIENHGQDKQPEANRCGDDNRTVLPPLMLSRIRGGSEMQVSQIASGHIVPYDPVRDLNPYIAALMSHCLGGRTGHVKGLSSGASDSHLDKLQLLLDIYHLVESAATAAELTGLIGRSPLVPIGGVDIPGTPIQSMQTRFMQARELESIGEDNRIDTRCMQSLYDPALCGFVPGLRYWVDEPRYLAEAFFKSEHGNTILDKHRAKEDKIARVAKFDNVIPFSIWPTHWRHHPTSTHRMAVPGFKPVGFPIAQGIVDGVKKEDRLQFELGWEYSCQQAAERSDLPYLPSQTSPVPATFDVRKSRFYAYWQCAIAYHNAGQIEDDRHCIDVAKYMHGRNDIPGKLTLTSILEAVRVDLSHSPIVFVNCAHLDRFAACARKAEDEWLKGYYRTSPPTGISYRDAQEYRDAQQYLRAPESLNSECRKYADPDRTPMAWQAIVASGCRDPVFDVSIRADRLDSRSSRPEPASFRVARAHRALILHSPTAEHLQPPQAIGDAWVDSISPVGFVVKWELSLAEDIDAGSVDVEGICVYWWGPVEGSECVKDSVTSYSIQPIGHGVYSVAIAAYNSAGEGRRTIATDIQVGNSRRTPSEPDVPARLLLRPGEGEIAVSWSAPDDNGASIDRFEVRWRRTGGSSWSKQAVSGSSSSYTVGGLRDGTAYEVRVRARNSVGWSDWSRLRSATPKTAASAPGAPPGLSVTAGDGQVDVSWGAAAQNSSPVTGYTVSWSGNGVADGSSQLGASARSYTITGLTNGTGYTVSVVAHSAVGDSAASSLAAFPKAAARVPDAPRSLSVTAGDGDIEVSWRASLENGAAVTGYRVAWSDGVAIGWKDRSSSARSYTIPGLRNGTRYEVSVVAQSSAGMSSVSTGYVTPVAKAAKPCTLRRPSLSGGEGRITASWAAPCDNGAAIDRYQVRWRRSGQSSWSDWAGSGSSRSRTISGLRDGATYEVQVRARNSVGWSDWSSSATAATDDADAGSVSVSAGPVNAARTGKGSCGSGNDCHDLRYTISGLGSGPYALECWFDGRREWRGQWSGKASTGCFYSSAFSGAVHVVVDGVKSNTISLTGRLPVSAPDAPGRPSLAAGDGEIAVSWSPPGDNGASIDRYEVRWRRSGGSSWSKQAVAGSTSSHEVTGLSNGVSYEVRVRARNGVGWSDWSPSATATPEDAATPPDAPPGLAVTAGDGEMAVSWRASRDNGAAVTGYSVRWSGDGVSDSRRLGASARNHVITGLRNGAGYTVSVVAHSVVGDSAASSLAAFPKAPARVPDAPRGLSLTAGDGEIGVSWRASRENGAAVTGYLVAWSDGVVIGGKTLSASARSYTITGLRSGVRYEVEVAAQSSAGTSQSATAYATTKAAVAVSVPDAPSRPILRDDDGSAQVSWSAPADNGASIDRYEVRYRRSGRSSWSAWDGSGSSRRLRITGTSAGTTYEAQVRARNSEGWGPWSPTATVTTQQSQASVAISAGPVNSRRTNQGSCGANDCHDLRYTIRGLGNGPYATECWFNGRLPAGASFTWSGNASTGCYYWSTFRGTIYVVVDGVKSNTITIR